MGFAPVPRCPRLVGSAPRLTRCEGRRAAIKHSSCCKSLLLTLRKSPFQAQRREIEKGALHTDHAPANFTTLKHMAHNLIRKAPSKDLIRLRRKTAAWDDDFLASLLAA